jgi:hypothetical protein
MPKGVSVGVTLIKEAPGPIPGAPVRGSDCNWRSGPLSRVDLAASAVRTILGMAAAVVFLGLGTADLSRSTTANSRQTGHVSMATTVARSAMVDNVQAPVIDPNIEFFLAAADGSVGPWIRPPTLRP